MDNFIKWLFQTTENGATYLQVIIIGALLGYVLYTMIDSIKETYTKLKEESK